MRPGGPGRPLGRPRAPLRRTRRRGYRGDTARRPRRPARRTRASARAPNRVRVAGGPPRSGGARYPVLELDVHPDVGRDGLEYLGESRDGILRAEHVELLERLVGEVPHGLVSDATWSRREPLEGPVVEHDEFAVGARHDVDLDGVCGTLGTGRFADRRNRVLGVDTRESAVGDDRRRAQASYGTGLIGACGHVEVSGCRPGGVRSSRPGTCAARSARLRRGGSPSRRRPRWW